MIFCKVIFHEIRRLNINQIKINMGLKNPVIKITLKAIIEYLFDKMI